MENTSYSVLCNMYFQGNVGHENMAVIKTKNYTVEIKREEVQREFLPIQYCYRCILIFKDLTGREIQKLVFNESQASVFIDNISTFISSDFEELVLVSGVLGRTIDESYTITLELSSEQSQGDFCGLMKVLCCNNVIQTITPTFTCLFEFNELSNLIDTMFFIYLIDLESERQSIYKV